jgi:hypothetical protein
MLRSVYRKSKLKIETERQRFMLMSDAMKKLQARQSQTNLLKYV